jgi:hypothetical protein
LWRDRDRRGGGDPIYSAALWWSTTTARPQRLNELDAGRASPPIAVDGVCGPASIAAMARHGFQRWRDVASAARG